MLRKIKELGFKVGYYGHDEFASWVWRKRKELLEEAEKIGILEEAKRAYEQGKSIGQKKRAFDERKKKEKEAREKRRRELLTKLEIEREVIMNYNDQVVATMPKSIKKPKIIEKPKFVEVPRILRRFFSGWE